MLTHCVTECVHVICTAEDVIMLNNSVYSLFIVAVLLQRTEADICAVQCSGQCGIMHVCVSVCSPNRTLTR